jgi:hypothetical protein
MSSVEIFTCPPLHDACKRLLARLGETLVSLYPPGRDPVGECEANGASIFMQKRV